MVPASQDNWCNRVFSCWYLRGGVNERGIAGLERVSGVREIMRGHALEHDGGGSFGGDVRGNFDELGGGDHGVIGIRAAGHGIGDAIANGDGGDVFADGDNRARAFVTEREGGIGFIEAETEIDVNEVDAGVC